jgi:hypothetical protein
MCHSAITVQPAFVLTAKTQPVPHSDLVSLQVFQTFPTARNPTAQRIFSVCLTREELHNFGRLLVSESYVTT